MKFRFKIVLLILAIGVISMFSYYNELGRFKYKNYSSESPDINITLDYISDWKFAENRDADGKYAQIIFIEPKKEDGFKAHIAVTVKSNSGMQPDDFTIVKVEQDFLEKRLKFKDAKVLSKSDLKILNTQARDIRLTYKTLDKLYHADAKLVSVKERIIIFKKLGKFFIVKYLNREESFADFDKAFSHIIETIKLKD